MARLGVCDEPGPFVTWVLSKCQEGVKSREEGVKSCEDSLKRASRLVNWLHEGNSVKRVSRVVKRVQSTLQAHVKKVSREWQMDVKICQEGVKDSQFVRAWASCQEVQCAKRMSKICQEL